MQHNPCRKLLVTGLVLVHAATDTDAGFLKPALPDPQSTTIEEERSAASSPARTLLSKKSTTECQPIFIVDPEMASIDSLSPEPSIWDDERGVVALRRYYALRDEAQDTITESK